MFIAEFAVVDVVQDLNRLLRNGKCPALCKSVYGSLDILILAFCPVVLTDVDHAISCLSALFRYLEVSVLFFIFCFYAQKTY